MQPAVSTHVLSLCESTALVLVLGCLHVCLSVSLCLHPGCFVPCRWPQKFELQMRAFRNNDRRSKTAVRSCAFPSPSLLEALQPSAPCNAETGTGV